MGSDGTSELTFRPLTRADDIEPTVRVDADDQAACRQARHSLAELQVTFSILVLVQAIFSPFQGVLIDHFGPRLLISIGTLLAGVSWVLASGA